MDPTRLVRSVVIQAVIFTLLWAFCGLEVDGTPATARQAHPHQHHLRHGGGSSSSNRLIRHQSRHYPLPQIPAESELLPEGHKLEIHQDAREMDDGFQEFMRRPTAEVEEDDEDEREFEPDEELAAAEAPKVGCKNCAQRKAEAESQLTPEEIKQIRIEDIKRQILRKLRMKARPNVTIPRNLLPTPLSDGEVSLRGPGTHQITRDLDDYYGKTEQIIVFPQQTPNRCFQQYDHSSSCLYFSLESNLPEGEITSAELWVYKLRDRRDVQNQSFSVVDLPADNYSILKKRNFVAYRETPLKTGWIKFNVKQAVKRWLLHPKAVHGLEVICRTCGREYDVAPISTEAGQRPFLVLTTNSASSEDRRRTKRSINCGVGTSQCCREELFISFKDIGWDDWILQPEGYRANYCRGSCLEVVALSLSNSHHVTFMQRYIQKQVLDTRLKEQLAPCCTSTRMSAISLLYVDENRKIFQKNLPNMVVDTCGCS